VINRCDSLTETVALTLDERKKYDFYRAELLFLCQNQLQLILNKSGGNLDHLANTDGKFHSLRLVDIEKMPSPLAEPDLFDKIVQFLIMISTSLYDQIKFNRTSLFLLANLATYFLYSRNL
jgi:hypothetical protein